jgi:malonyl-CoA O-methyltransferase
VSEIANVKAGCDRWAAVYDTDGNPMQALEGLAVLDLGCGTGRHALHLAQMGAVVTAVDSSEGMLAEARRKPGADSVDFRSHDLREPLPFTESEFDLVVSGLVLEHLNDLELFFSEIHRVVKPHGRTIVSAMHPAMFLRGSQARFTDPASGDLVHPGSVDHKLSDMVMVAVVAGFDLRSIEEKSPDAGFIDRFDMKAS